jgi:hypothetical protein
MIHIWAFGRGSAFCGNPAPDVALSPTAVGSVPFRSICPDCTTEWLRDQVRAGQRIEECAALEPDGARSPILATSPHRRESGAPLQCRTFPNQTCLLQETGQLWNCVICGAVSDWRKLGYEAVTIEESADGKRSYIFAGHDGGPPETGCLQVLSMRLDAVTDFDIRRNVNAVLRASEATQIRTTDRRWIRLERGPLAPESH